MCKKEVVQGGCSVLLGPTGRLQFLRSRSLGAVRGGAEKAGAEQADFARRKGLKRNPRISGTKSPGIRARNHRG